MIWKKGFIGWAVIVLVAALPLLGGCESKKQREEIAKLTSQVQTLTKEKEDLLAKVDGAMQEQAKLKAQVDDLTKKLSDAEAKLTAAKPKSKTPAPAPKKAPAKK